MRSVLLTALCAMTMLALAPGARAGEPVSATLADVSWLAGSWVRTAEGEHAQEMWSAPEAGSMTGAFRWVRGGRVMVHEFMLLEEVEGRIELRLRHFGAGMRAWEEAPLVFDLTELEGKVVVFEQRDDDTPTTLRYEMLEDGSVRFTFVEKHPEREQRFVIDFVKE